jgi:hypothetical protein
MSIFVFWGVTPCGFKAADGGSMFLRNVHTCLQVHTILLPTTLTTTSANGRVKPQVPHAEEQFILTDD